MPVSGVQVASGYFGKRVQRSVASKVSPTVYANVYPSLLAALETPLYNALYPDLYAALFADLYTPLYDALFLALQTDLFQPLYDALVVDLYAELFADLQAPLQAVLEPFIETTAQTIAQAEIALALADLETTISDVVEDILPALLIDQLIVVYAYIDAGDEAMLNLALDYADNIENNIYNYIDDDIVPLLVAKLDVEQTEWDSGYISVNPRTSYLIQHGLGKPLEELTVEFYTYTFNNLQNPLMNVGGILKLNSAAYSVGETPNMANGVIVYQEIAEDNFNECRFFTGDRADYFENINGNNDAATTRWTSCQLRIIIRYKTINNLV